MDTLGLLGQALECSICLEQLDVSSRVLPCQHTFCTSCLLDIISSHKELRCPECRALVTVPFDSLKPNIILMRILEGMKNIPQEPFIKKQSLSSSLQPQEELMKHTIANSHSPNSPTIACVSNSIPHLTRPKAQLLSPCPYSSDLLCPSISESSNLPLSASNSSQDISMASVPSYSASTNPFFNLTSQPSKHNESPCLFPTNFSTSSDLNDLSPSINIFHNIQSNPDLPEQVFNSSASNQKTSIEPFSSLQTSVNDNIGQLQNISPFVSLPSLSNVGHLGPESSINFQTLVSPLNTQARALFNYEKREERDLSFKKGDTIQICKQIDENWLYGELNSNFGFIPSSYVTLLEPLPSHVPQCKALYDFKISVREERNCLTFNKGDTITVLRRIDDNWSEGKLNTHIGIFPLSFVQLNDSAKALLKVPTSGIRKDLNSSAVVSPPVASTTSSTLPLLSSLPSSIAKETTAIAKLISTKEKEELSKGNNSTDVHPQTTSASSPRRNRSLDVTNATENSKNLTKSNGNSNLDCSSAQSHSESTGKATSLTLYVALYSYRPRKADELELRKGYLYSVSDKCLDGWCKGRCLSTDKIGVFPGNYVQPAKAQTISAFLSRRSSNVLPSSPVHNFGSNTTSSSLNRNSSVKSTTIISNNRPLSSIASSLSADSYSTPSNYDCSLLDTPVNSIVPTLSPMTISPSHSPSLTPRFNPSPEFIHETSEENDLNHATSSPTIPPELPPRLGTMISSNICDQINSSRSEEGSTATFSPCSSPVSHNEMHKGAKELGSINRGIPMMKSTNAKKWENSCHLVSIDNQSFEESITTSEPSKKSKLKNVNVTPESNGSPKSSKHLVPLFIERYRCIEGYPPNGENELELQIGDLVYVHKKGEDGWYKGTLKRTGKTGLFPASFVQKF